MSKMNRQSGFTLIELLLYVAIVGSLLTAVSLYFVSSAGSRVKNQTIVEVNQQGALAMERITQTIRNANSITSPSAGSSASSLSLVVPTGSLSPTVFNLYTGGGNDGLQVTEGANPAVLLTNDKVVISNLTFTNLTRSGTPGVVQISFTVTRFNPNNKNEYDHQKTFTSTAAVRP